MNARNPTAVFATTVPPSSLPPTEKESTVFMSGNSQAVRIPKEFQLKTKQVKIILRNGELVIKPKYQTGAEILANLPPLSEEDFDDGFDLAALVGKSNLKLAKERDLSCLLSQTARQPRAKTLRVTSKVKAKTSA